MILARYFISLDLCFLGSLQWGQGCGGWYLVRQYLLNFSPFCSTQSPPTHTPAPNKDPFRSEPVWGRVETGGVIPPRLGQAQHGAAHTRPRQPSHGCSGLDTPALISPEASSPASLESPSAVTPPWSWLLVKMLSSFRPVCDPV